MPKRQSSSNYATSGHRAGLPSEMRPVPRPELPTFLCPRTPTEKSTAFQALPSRIPPRETTGCGLTAFSEAILKKYSVPCKLNARDFDSHTNTSTSQCLPELPLTDLRINEPTMQRPLQVTPEDMARITLVLDTKTRPDEISMNRILDSSKPSCCKHIKTGDSEQVKSVPELTCPLRAMTIPSVVCNHFVSSHSSQCCQHRSQGETPINVLSLSTVKLTESQRRRKRAKKEHRKYLDGNKSTSYYKRKQDKQKLEKSRRNSLERSSNEHIDSMELEHHIPVLITVPPEFADSVPITESSKFEEFQNITTISPNNPLPSFFCKSGGMIPTRSNVIPLPFNILPKTVPQTAIVNPTLGVNTYGQKPIPRSRTPSPTHFHSRIFESRANHTEKPVDLGRSVRFSVTQTSQKETVTSKVSGQNLSFSKRDFLPLFVNLDQLTNLDLPSEAQYVKPVDSSISVEEALADLPLYNTSYPHGETHLRNRRLLPNSLSQRSSSIMTSKTVRVVTSDPSLECSGFAKSYKHVPKPQYQTINIPCPVGPTFATTLQNPTERIPTRPRLVTTKVTTKKVLADPIKVIPDSSKLPVRVPPQISDFVSDKLQKQEGKSDTDWTVNRKKKQLSLSYQPTYSPESLGKPVQEYVPQHYTAPFIKQSNKFNTIAPKTQRFNKRSPQTLLQKLATEGTNKVKSYQPYNPTPKTLLLTPMTPANSLGKSIRDNIWDNGFEFDDALNPQFVQSLPEKQDLKNQNNVKVKNLIITSTHTSGIPAGMEDSSGSGSDWETDSEDLPMRHFTYRSAFNSKSQSCSLALEPNAPDVLYPWLHEKVLDPTTLSWEALNKKYKGNIIVFLHFLHTIVTNYIKNQLAQKGTKHYVPPLTAFTLLKVNTPHGFENKEPEIFLRATLHLHSFLKHIPELFTFTQNSSKGEFTTRPMPVYEGNIYDYNFNKVRVLRYTTDIKNGGAKNVVQSLRNAQVKNKKLRIYCDTESYQCTGDSRSCPNDSEIQLICGFNHPDTTSTYTHLSLLQVADEFGNAFLFDLMPRDEGRELLVQSGMANLLLDPEVEKWFFAKGNDANALHQDMQCQMQSDFDIQKLFMEMMHGYLQFNPRDVTQISLVNMLRYFHLSTNHKKKNIVWSDPTNHKFLYRSHDFTNTKLGLLRREYAALDVLVLPALLHQIEEALIYVQ